MTDEQYIRAVTPLRDIQAGIKKGDFSTALTAEDEKLYATIPDNFKQLMANIFALRKPYNADYDVRDTLGKKGLVELWKRRDDIALAFDLGYKARQ